MIVSREREKLLNAIVFFCKKTKHCHTLKLFKLLNFLDFEHYRQTGRTVTGLDYKAWPQGPVPSELWHEMQKAPRQDLLAALGIFTERDEITNKVLRRDLKPKKQFDPKYFSKRELAIMDRLAEFFADTKGDDMSEFSHMRGLPWRKVWEGGKGNGKKIPINLALNAPPIVHDVPTIESDELALRKDLRRDLV